MVKQNQVTDLWQLGQMYSKTHFILFHGISYVKNNYKSHCHQNTTSYETYSVLTGLLCRLKMKTSLSSCTENRAKQHAWQTSCFHVCDHIKNLCTGILTAKLKFKLLVDVHIIMATKPEFLPNFWSLKMKCYGSQF